MHTDHVGVRSWKKVHCANADARCLHAISPSDVHLMVIMANIGKMKPVSATLLILSLFLSLCWVACALHSCTEYTSLQALVTDAPTHSRWRNHSHSVSFSLMVFSMFLIIFSPLSLSLSLSLFLSTTRSKNCRESKHSDQTSCEHRADEVPKLHTTLLLGRKRSVRQWDENKGRNKNVS